MFFAEIHQFWPKLSGMLSLSLSECFFVMFDFALAYGIENEDRLQKT